MREDIQRDWQGKRVAVVGLGVSNRALIRFLQAAGAVVCGMDRQSLGEIKDVAELTSLGIDLVLGDSYLEGLAEYDCVFVSPGVPKDLPELQEVYAQGKVNSEIELVFRYSRAPIYAVTGSSGKTTTTSLIRDMLRAHGASVYAGGNIGVPLINEISQIGPDDCVVLELSSFQLDRLPVNPRGALITNLAPNHLDIHHTMEAYTAAKENIFLGQGKTDFLVVNYDDPITRAMEAKAQSKVFFFSLKGKALPGTYLDGDDLVYEDGKERIVFAKRSQIKLMGEHNVANILAAALASRLAGADWQAIAQVCREFRGVAHRLELVGEVDGVSYYNDSIATTPDRTQAALNSFSQPIILLAGGSDKQLSYTELGRVIHQRAKQAVLFGATGPAIRQAILDSGPCPIEMVSNLEEAVMLASKVAETGDVVLLSPASASFDQYSDFTARGEHFRSLVSRLTTKGGD
jgi:UDP-N-acetylmuramoylalanine--D-glutamate ligase